MVFYITFSDFDALHHGIGVEKKIINQTKVLMRSLGETYYTYYSSPWAYLMRVDGKIIEKDVAVTRKDYTAILVEWLQKYSVTKTYIRYPRSNKWFIDLLRFQKDYGIKTVLEIPTFPYRKLGDDLEDLIYREQIRQYVDKVSTYSADEEIWGIPCIRLVNGIVLEDIFVSTRKRMEKRIEMIAVSSMRPCHGYERILEGMYLYYKNKGEYDLYFRMVGSGEEEQKYRDLVIQYHLEQNVEFVGRIELWEDERLNQQYSLSDLAVGLLGGYKENRDGVSSIKGSEYCAKTLPFISGYHEPGFPKDWEFMMVVPNNPTPVDMDKVVMFYENVIAKAGYKEIMRDYAVNYLTWDHIMNPIIEYLIE